MRRVGNSDDTVVQRRPHPKRHWAAWSGLVLLLIVGGVAGNLALRPAPPPASFALRTAGEAEIAADQPQSLTLFRFAPNPLVLVLDFASLHEQGMMLNRVAAFVEKAGLPHDRVLNDTELATAIRASGDTVETWYLGHDYPAAALARFFDLAERDQVALGPQEEWLRGFVVRQGWRKPGANGALISLPRVGAEPLIDDLARQTILHHELSHGEYFTDPVYAAYVRHFWHDVLGEADRADFRHFLGSEGYDTGIEDLMTNEMQAYLMHTRDPRFFNAQALGMAPDRMALLQALFLLHMPEGWLKQETPAPAEPAAANQLAPAAPAAPLPAAPASAAAPVRAPRRRRQRLSCVFRTTAVPASLPPRPRTASIAA
ncbi:MAG: hypothetical protein JO264_18195 [Acidisphaera sp.]|nr:hypothetical protein [Acidisphaera sp.]